MCSKSRLQIQGDSLARGPRLLSNADHRQMQVTGRAQYIAGGRPCCLPPLPVCVYKFSSHYLNNTIFYRQKFGASSERITLYKTRVQRVDNPGSKGGISAKEM